MFVTETLQYVEDPDRVMQEIFRVSKHKGIVCVVVPYMHVSCHLANPEFKQLYNEHWPRFLTQSTHSLLPQEEYVMPLLDRWG